MKTIPQLLIYKRYDYFQSLLKYLPEEKRRVCIYVCSSSSSSSSSKEGEIHQACSGYLHGLSSLGNMT